MEMGDGFYEFECSFDFDDEVSESAHVVSWLEKNSSRLIKQEFKLIAKFDRFSEMSTEDENMKSSSDFHVETREDDIFRDISYYLPLITIHYENGRSYVSIILRRSFLLSDDPFVLSCVVSVIDSSGEERYSKTYLKHGIPKWRKRRIAIDFSSEEVNFEHLGCCNICSQHPTLLMFISRETLLRGSDELLPNDCLKLQIACNLQFLKRIQTRAFEKYLKSETGPTEPIIIDRNFLRLHLEAQQALCEATDYLKTGYIIHMLEYRKSYRNISVTIIRGFLLICEIVEKTKVLKIESFEDFHKMLILADYYNYGSIRDACRIIQKCFLCCKIGSVSDSYMKATEFDASLFPESERDTLHSFIRETVPEERRGTDVTHIVINGLKYTCRISSANPIVMLVLCKSAELELSKKANLEVSESDDFDFYQ